MNILCNLKKYKQSQVNSCTDYFLLINIFILREVSSLHIPGTNNINRWYKAYDLLIFTILPSLLVLPHVFLTSHKDLFQGDMNYLYIYLYQCWRYYWGLGWGSHVIAQNRFWLDLLAALFIIPPCNKLQGVQCFWPVCQSVGQSYTQNACWI